MADNESTYMIDVNGQVSGPHSVSELLLLRISGHLPDNTLIRRKEETWSQANPLRHSPVLLSRLQQHQKGSLVTVQLPSGIQTKIPIKPLLVWFGVAIGGVVGLLSLVELNRKVEAFSYTRIAASNPTDTILSGAFAIGRYAIPFAIIGGIIGKIIDHYRKAE